MTPDDAPPLPDPCAVAFKEWEGVCLALERGRQSLILRKGGIEEGPGGFRPEHAAFWLYPTRVHQAQQGLKPEAAGWVDPGQDVPDGVVPVGALAVVESLGFVDRPDRLAELDDLHVWTAETVEKRFQYRTPGLWVLGVRVYRRSEPWRVTVTPEQAGCKTWVPLGAGLSTAGLTPVLDGAAHTEALGRLAGVLGPARGPGR